MSKKPYRPVDRNIKQGVVCSILYQHPSY